MVYETYETESFVLSAKNIGEGDRLFDLFTEEFGRIRAQAKNVRAEKSKLRYNLQPLSRVHVAIIRGKEYWRIVGVKDADHLFLSSRDNPEALIIIRRVFNLLQRLLSGEEKNARLFSIVKGCIDHMSSGNVIPVRSVEILTVARVLSALGYFPQKDEYKDLLVDGLITDNLVADTGILLPTILSDINEALRETHL